MRSWGIRAAVGVWLWATLAGMAWAEAPFQFDPYWLLLHERAVPDDLKLTSAQRTAWKQTLDPLDVRFFMLRSKSTQEATDGQAQIVAEARPAIGKVLQPSQQARLEALLARRLGTKVLLHEDFAARLGLTDAQRPEVKAAIEEVHATLAKLRESKDKPASDIQKETAEIETAHSKRLVSILTSAQQSKWQSLVATDFDLARFGRTAFQPPELTGNDWQNSPPMTLAKLKGQVVVVHFFAFGCINCVHNYPVYRQWQSELAGKGVTLVGIHTPETGAERNLDNLIRKAKEDDLRFPILHDGDSANWRAWGNTMWPCVYVLDKRGQLRYFWPGELRWEGAAGDKIARGWIDELLAEEP